MEEWNEAPRGGHRTEMRKEGYPFQAECCLEGVLLRIGRVEEDIHVFESFHLEMKCLSPPHAFAKFLPPVGVAVDGVRSREVPREVGV